MAALTRLGHRLVAGLALGLGLDESYFADRLTGEPLTLFRIFNYPPPRDPTLWGVGEHTDYGLLTILLQDDAGGLEVRSRSRWVPAPPVPGAFVCNIGDMLDRLTRGLLRSTPHRVRNPAPRDRLSLPFFFDPGFFARVRPIDLPGREVPPDDRADRWDHASVHAFEGTYGDYLPAKVGKVFPELRQRETPPPRGSPSRGVGVCRGEQHSHVMGRELFPALSGGHLLGRQSRPPSACPADGCCLVVGDTPSDYDNTHSGYNNDYVPHTCAGG
jgi:hypothetical protein